MLKFDKLFYLLLLIPVLLFANPTRVYIASDTTAENIAPQIRLLRDLFTVDSTGYTHDPVRRDSLVSLLKTAGIITDGYYSDDGTILTLLPGVAVRDIKIRGAFPLFKSEIERVMTILSGDFITEEKIEQQKELIANKLMRNGIINPVITIELEKLKKYPGLVNLRVEIQSKATRSVKKLTYSGSDKFGIIRHGMKFHHWHYQTLLFFPRRYMEEDLRDDVRALRGLYRFSGYGDATVTVTDSLLSVDEKTKDEEIALHVQINPGIVNKVKLNKASPLKRRKVRANFDISQKGNKNNSTIKRGMVQTRKTLRELGYSGAKVIVTDTTITRGKRYEWDCKYHTVTVVPGKRIAIDSITITGNKFIDESKIKSLMLTREGRMKKRKYQGTFSKQTFLKDIEEIEKYYISQGFFNASVKGSYQASGDSVQNSVAVSVKITENTPCIVNTIEISGIPDDKKEIIDSLSLLLSNKKDSLFLPLKVFPDRIHLTAKIKQMGYPFAEVQESESYNHDSTKVDLTYQINPYHSATTGRIIYWGNFTTQEKLLDRTIGIKTGEPFSLQKLNEGIKELRDLGIFGTVNYRIPAMERKGDALDIIVTLEELKSISLSGAVGFETEKRFYVKSSILKENLWGLNKSILLSGEFSAIERGIITTFTEPHLFYTDIVGTISLYARREQKQNVAYQTRFFGNSYSLGYDLKQKIMVSTTFSYIIKQNLGVDSTYIDTTNGGESVVTDTIRHTFHITPKITLDKRDSFVRPRMGAILTGSSEISKGLSINLDNYWKLEAEGKAYFSPLSKLTIAIRMRTGIVRSYGENDYVPSDELFMLGGTGSVRGYQENSLFITEDGTSRAGMGSYDGSFELRPELAENIEIPLFFDIGALSFSQGFADVEKPKYSVGTGFRFITPIGPIGLVYGLKLNPGKRDKELDNPGAFHFSIGYSF